MNRLEGESSPYLLAHAGNPVDWFPWGTEALEKARREDLPVFLSIGYSACHWCHVMERESFQNPVTAEILNRHFVSVKVDREERPDLDSLYMTAVQAITGGGGWPLSVFLLPDGTPFYGGTYFPPEDKAARYGVPSFPAVLLRVAEAFRNGRDELSSSGKDLLESLRRHCAPLRDSTPLNHGVSQAAFQAVTESFDSLHGGFGGAPKFPQPMVLEFLLRFHHRTGNSEALNMVEFTLEAMSRGGIRDHLGGGFHRYSTDRLWLVPHFEKMLYDNALLAGVYTEAYQITGKALYGTVAEEILDYMTREMRHPEGGYFSTQDADSEVPHRGHKEEGAFFVWTRKAVQEILGSDAGAFCEMFDVTDSGNFQGRNILRMPRTLPETAVKLNVSPLELTALSKRSRLRLRSVREARPRPFRDEKILTSWNGLAVRALASAASALQRDDYLENARICALFLLNELRGKDGLILRVWKNGKAYIFGFLEDYALLAHGLLALYRVDGAPGWLQEAVTLADRMVSLFHDRETGLFNDTGTNHEALVVRPRDPSDNATPSGTSVAVQVLLELWAITGDERFLMPAEAVLSHLASAVRGMPLGFGRMLCAVEFLIAPPKRINFIGAPCDPGCKALLRHALGSFHPEVVMLRTPGASGEKCCAEVCVAGACLPRAEDPEALESLLRQ